MYQIRHFSCNKAYFGVFFWLRVFQDYSPCYVCKRGWGLCLRGPVGKYREESQPHILENKDTCEQERATNDDN